MSTTPHTGRIVTFYSYKGGTGRSMILANVACVLASNGKRVLVVDWDVEAPGLHRYFAPFLVDPDLDSSPGVVDLMTRFTVAVTTPSEEPVVDVHWLDELANIDLYATSMQMNLPGWKDIDFMPAGQLDSTYAERVTSFDWRNFYERLHGGALIDRLRKQMHEEYDYVLIDSRTGVTDTAGICTVHLPDDLVCCFTFNNQGLEGAAGVAKSVRQHRRKDGEIRILPVPSRVEINEKERLDGARTRARRAFREHLGWLQEMQIGEEDYWGAVEVPYWPYYAFEENLAAFADPPGKPTSILAAAERIARFLTRGEITRLGPVDPARANEIVSAFQRAPAPVASQRVFVSYAADDLPFAKRVAERLTAAGLQPWLASSSPSPGSRKPSPLEDDIASAIASSKHLVALVGKKPSSHQMFEWSTFLSGSIADATSDRRLVPIVSDEADVSALPGFMRQLRYFHGRDETAITNVVRSLTSQTFLDIEPEPSDPQKGKWGGKAEANGRRLVASVAPTASDNGWFHLELRVESTDEARPLEKSVRFHLHDTFPTPNPEIPVTEGIAWLEIVAWGAFTVGAEADGGSTKLELDLAQLEDAPELFKSR